MKKFLKHDDEVREFTSRKELNEYLDFRKEHDEWVTPFLNELSCVGIPCEPLFIPQYCTNVKAKKNGYTIDLPDIDHGNPDNADCIRNVGLFLVFPYRNGIETWPIRMNAYKNVCERCGDNGAVMTRMEARPNKALLPINEKADRLNRDFQLLSDGCKILLRDEKVSAVLSKEYVIMPADELLCVLEDEIFEEHPDYKFDRALVSHEYLMVEFLLDNIEMEEAFRLRLNDAGADISELKAGIRFSTSDVGLSKVNATLFYDADGVRTSLGDGVSIEHKGDASVAKFGERCKDIAILFKECEQRIEELGNMVINNPADVLAAIRERYTFLPKGTAEEVENELRISMPCGGTGIDVYLALNDIVQRQMNQAGMTPSRYLSLSEEVAKLIRLPFDKIDAGEDWSRI